MSDVDAPLNAEQFNRIVREKMPFVEMMGVVADELDEEEAVVRVVHRAAHLRPGGTVAGPVMMGLADVAFYAALLGRIGSAGSAVTTNLSIHFFRRPPPGDIVATARVLKLGKRLAVCEATLCSEVLGDGEPVAHATGTYSIPPSEGEVVVKSEGK